jgi:lambda family phage portal protein
MAKKAAQPGNVLPVMPSRKKASLQSQFSAAKADYEMNRISRFVRKRTGVAPRGSGADYHFRTETKYYEGMEQARDMDRNDAVIGILSDRRVDNIVQSGFKLDPKTGDKKLDLDLWQRFMAWAADPDLCDITGEMCFAEQERTVCRASTVDGDIVAIGTDSGALQLVEAHLIQTRGRVADTFLGVTTDQYGRRTHYHVIEEKDQFGTFGNSTPIPVRDDNGRRQVFHVYNPNRVLQTRGVTALAPVFTYAGMLEDINFAKLVQQQAASCFAIIHEYSSGSNVLPTKAGYGESTTVTTPSGTRSEEGISPGMEYHGVPGQGIKGFSPNIPNSEYFQQVRLILQVLGVNFGLPLCLVLMDGSETNFSGWRGAVDEARKGFVADQLNLVRRFHKPVYEWWLTREIEGDAALQLMAGKLNIYAHNWNLPTWSYIEPVADAEGDATQLRNALTSPRRLHAARGNDWEELTEEIVADNHYAIEQAAKKAAEFNEANPFSPPLTWRDLIALPMPEGQTLALQDPAVVAKQEDANASGEAVGLSRRDLQNRNKAINDVLTQLKSGTISDQRARLDLDGLGIPPDKIDAYILDIADGTIDSPELQNAQ